MANFTKGIVAAVVPLIAFTSGNPAPRLATRSHNLSQGLAIWRKPGAIQGHAACATCHSPDGIEIAAYNFSDGDIKRRAIPHLNAGDADILVDYVHALREKFGFSKLRDPKNDRPLQPGGEVLPGKTVAERDIAFGKELTQQLPILFGSPITRFEQARGAEAELINLDLSQLKIGIPLNRLSEDIAHGKDHASIAEWLPEFPPLIPEAAQSKWYEMQDRYLSDPSMPNLQEMLREQAQVINTTRMSYLEAIAPVKHRALLVWQDRLRHHTENDPNPLAQDMSTPGSFNTLWAVGDFARAMVNQSADTIGMDADLKSKKMGAIPLGDQLHQLRVAWMWIGWMSDQGLFRTSRRDETRLGLWLSQSLIDDGPYPIHNVFAAARRQAVISNNLDSWGETLVRRRRIWDFASIRPFKIPDGPLQTNPAYLRLYKKFLANCYRMNLLLLKHDIETSGKVWIKISARSNADALAQAIKLYEPDQAKAVDQLQIELDKLIDGATERR